MYGKVKKKIKIQRKCNPCVSDDGVEGDDIGEDDDDDSDEGDDIGEDDDDDSDEGS